jgi:hypothetical protein
MLFVSWNTAHQSEHKTQGSLYFSLFKFGAKPKHDMIINFRTDISFRHSYIACRKWGDLELYAVYLSLKIWNNLIKIRFFTYSVLGILKFINPQNKNKRLHKILTIITFLKSKFFNLKKFVWFYQMFVVKMFLDKQLTFREKMKNMIHNAF